MTRRLGHEALNVVVIAAHHLRVLHGLDYDIPLIGAAVAGLRAAREPDGIGGDVLRFARELTPAISLGGADEPAQRAASTCQMLAEAAGVTLKVSIAAETEPVEIDAGLMAQALANLVRNAVEAIAEEGANGAPCVRVITRLIEVDGREAVEYAVEDNGPGVPDGTIERMFNPFYTTRQTGCGLGLAMVQRIVDAHGGSVEASSVMRDGVAAGARFVLRVPARASGSPSMNESLVTEGAA